MSAASIIDAHEALCALAEELGACAAAQCAEGEQWAPSDFDEMGECELCECATPAGRDVCDECAVNLAHDGALVSVDGGDE